MADPHFVGDDPDPKPTPAADPKAARKAAGPRFKQDTAAADSRRPVAIVVVLFLLAALGGVLVGFSQFFGSPPHPQLEAIHVERYDHPTLGVADWASADARALVKAFRDADGERIASADLNSHQADKLRGRLAKWKADLARPDAGREPRAFSVSGLAAVRPSDKAVCLLASNANPHDPAAADAWVPLDDILAAVGGDPAGRRLLLLDLARPNADPFNGRSAETAAAAVCDLLKKRQVDGTLPCPVLVSAAPGEMSWPAAREQRSAFGLYLADGLQGAAAGDGKADEVTVTGLAKFVARGVGRYVRTVHDRPQHPHLYAPTGFKDFALVARVRPTGPTVPTDPLKPEEYAYPPSLRAAWKRWDALLTANADHDRPEGFARLTAGILRAERAWLGTGRAEYAKDISDTAFGQWDEVAGGSRPAGRPADDAVDPRLLTARLRLAARDVPTVPDELPGLLGKYLDARLAPDAKAESGRADRQAWLDKAANPAGVRLVWRRLCDDPEPGRKRLVALSELLVDQTEREKTPPLERLIARLVKDRQFIREQELSDFPAEAVTAWFKAEDAIGRALAAGPTGFAKAVPAMDAAEVSRKAGLAELFKSRRGTGGVAREAVEPFAKAAEGFTRAVAGSGAGPKVQAAIPPLLRAVLAHQPAATAVGGRELDQWVEATRLLDELTTGRGEAAVLAKAAGDAVELTKRMSDGFAPARVEEIEKRVPWGRPAEGKPDDVRTALALVAGPGLPADLRAKVWELIRREWWGRNTEARTLDAADTDNAKLPPEMPAVVAVDPDPADARRAEAAATLLRLAGGSDWRADLPRRAAEAVRTGDWVAVTRHLRVAPPAVAADPRKMPDAGELVRPAAADRAAYRRWVVAQIQDGYRLPVGGQPLIDKMDTGQAFRRALLD